MIEAMKTAKIFNNKKFTGYIALIIGIFSLSLSPILVKTAEARTVVTSFYRMFFSFCFWTIFLLYRIIRSPKENELTKALPDLRWLIFPLVAGVSSAMDHAWWATALNLTSVTNTGILNGMAPVWIAAAGFLFLHERHGWRFWFGLALSMVGIVLMSGKGFSFFSEGMNLGDRIALFSSFFYAGYYFFTQLGRRHYSTLFQTWVSAGFCSLTLWLICRYSGYEMVHYSPEVWKSFILVALLCQVCGYFSLTYALGSLPASIVSPSNELHTVLSSILAVILLGESISLPQGIGCAAITIGIYLINRR